MLAIGDIRMGLKLCCSLPGNTYSQALVTCKIIVYLVMIKALFVWLASSGKLKNGRF